MSLITIAFVVFIVMIVLTRAIYNKANLELTTEKKVELIEMASKNRVISYVILGIMLVVFVGVTEFEWYQIPYVWTVYTVAIAVLLTVNAILTTMKLKKYDFPESYIQKVNIVSAIRIAGIVIFFILIGINPL